MHERIAALALAAMLCGCGGGASNGDAPGGASGSSSEGPDPGTQVESSAGAAPRVVLGIAAPARTRLRAITESEQAVTVAGTTQERAVTSTVALDVVLEPDGESYRLDVLPELEGFEPSDIGYEALAPFPVRDELDERGERSRFDPRRDIHDALALDAFSLPALALSVPATAVGDGAVWTETVRLPLVTVVTRTTLEDLDDSTVTVDKRISVGSDERRRYRISGIVSAAYSRRSLLVESADIELSLRFEDELYVNGRLERVVDSRSYRQSLREIAP